MTARFLAAAVMLSVISVFASDIDTVLEASGIVGCDSAEATLVITARLKLDKMRLTECVYYFKNFYIEDVRYRTGGGITFSRSAGNIVCKKKLNMTDAGGGKVYFHTSLSIDRLDSAHTDSLVSVTLELETNHTGVGKPGETTRRSILYRIGSNETVQMAGNLSLHLRSDLRK